MRIATVKFTGVSQYQQGRFHETPKLDGELADDYEERTWMMRSHIDKETGKIVVPANSIKNCISEAAKFLNIQIPGKGKATFTKHFEAGILVIDNVITEANAKDVERVAVLGNSLGKRGQPGPRVKKNFPTIQSWGGVFKVYILDDIITEDVFRKVLEGAGKFIGLGVWRPRNSGTNGRFNIDSIEFQKD